MVVSKREPCFVTKGTIDELLSDDITKAPLSTKQDIINIVTEAILIGLDVQVVDDNKTPTHKVIIKDGSYDLGLEPLAMLSANSR